MQPIIGTFTVAKRADTWNETWYMITHHGVSADRIVDAYLDLIDAIRVANLLTVRAWHKAQVKS